VEWESGHSMTEEDNDGATMLEGIGQSSSLGTMAPWVSKSIEMVITTEWLHVGCFSLLGLRSHLRQHLLHDREDLGP
jgi:hypothetical protein